MANLPDETELEVDRSQLGLPPLEPTDEDLPTPEFDDMDSDISYEEDLDLPDPDDVLSEDYVNTVLDEAEEN